MKHWNSEDIKELRTKNKLSQKTFAELLGVSTNYVYLLEKKMKTPSKTLQLLLDCVEEKLRKGE